jgi:hypothetical protein
MVKLLLTLVDNEGMTTLGSRTVRGFEDNMIADTKLMKVMFAELRVQEEHVIMRGGRA